MTCIKDIHPVSTHHYLILPKEHIRNAKQLKPEHSELCKFSKIEKNLILCFVCIA